MSYINKRIVVLTKYKIDVGLVRMLLNQGVQVDAATTTMV